MLPAITNEKILLIDHWAGFKKPGFLKNLRFLKKPGLFKNLNLVDLGDVSLRFEGFKNMPNQRVLEVYE